MVTALVSPHSPINSEASIHWSPRSISVIKSLNRYIPTPKGMIRTPTNFWNLKNMSLNPSLSFWSLDNDENRTGVVAAVIIDVIWATVLMDVRYSPR